MRSDWAAEAPTGYGGTTMDSVNTMRWVLVNMAAAAAVVAAFTGFWTAALVLGMGVAVHTGHWLWHKRHAPAEPHLP